MYRTMDLDRARLIVWNPDNYALDLVTRAAVWILGSLRATTEDIDRATGLV